MKNRLYPRHASLRAAALALALLGVAAQAQAPQEVRIALVIGNAAYPALAELVNPVNDAAAMGGTLRTLGFDVTELKDGSQAQMREAVERVGARLRGKQAIALLYYAGHGLQVDFRNYMVPVDATLANAADVPAQTIEVAQVIEVFKAAGTRMNIVVLDACRDNPFGPGTARGLAPVDAPPGTFLAYATAPGNVAADGEGSNGLYTGFLVRELQKPATRIEDVFKRVRMQVRQSSRGQQIPWESTSLEEDFYFNDGVRFTFAAQDLERLRLAALEREQALQRDLEQARERERQQAAAQALQRLREAEAQRLKELELATAQAREAERLKRLSAERARQEAFATEKAAWDRIKDSRDVDDFYAFVKQFPSGSRSEHAQARIELLEQARIAAQPVAGARVQAPLHRRFREGDRYEMVQRDGLTGLETARAVIEVRYGVEDEIVNEVLSGSFPRMVSTAAGFIARDPSGSYDPPWAMVPGGDFQVGKRMQGRSLRTDAGGRTSWVEYETRIVAREPLETAFGRVDTYRVEVVRYLEAGLRQQMTFWFDPDWGPPVKTVIETRRGRGPNIIVREMLRRERRS